MATAMLQWQRWAVKTETRSSLTAQWVKDLVLSLQRLRLLLWCRFSPRPGNFHLLLAHPKKKKKKKRRRRQRPYGPQSWRDLLSGHFQKNFANATWIPTPEHWLHTVITEGDFFFFFLYWPPHSIQSSQARDQIQATAATYAAAAATPNPLTHLGRG